MLLYTKIDDSLKNVPELNRNQDFYAANHVLTLPIAKEVDLFKKKNICYAILCRHLMKVYIGASENSFYKRYPFNMLPKSLDFSKFVSSSELREDIHRYGIENFEISFLYSSDMPTKFNFFQEALWIRYLSKSKYLKLYNTIHPILHHFDWSNNSGSLLQDLGYVNNIKKLCHSLFSNRMDVLDVFFYKKKNNYRIPFVKLICNECGEVSKKSVGNLKLGKGCDICRFKTTKNAFKIFCDRANKKYNTSCNYQFIKNDKKRILVKCSICNQTTKQLRRRHLQNGCQSCAITRGKLKLQRKIAQFELKTGNIIQYFNSIEDAARLLKISSKNIPTVCNGKRNHAGGFGWKYVEN